LAVGAVGAVAAYEMYQIAGMADRSHHRTRSQAWPATPSAASASSRGTWATGPAARRGTWVTRPAARRGTWVTWPEARRGTWVTGPAARSVGHQPAACRPADVGRPPSGLPAGAAASVPSSPFARRVAHFCCPAAARGLGRHPRRRTWPAATALLVPRESAASARRRRTISQRVPAERLPLCKQNFVSKQTKNRLAHRVRSQTLTNKRDSFFLFNRRNHGIALLRFPQRTSKLMIKPNRQHLGFWKIVGIFITDNNAHRVQ
jgi:hypothetical protein